MMDRLYRWAELEGPLHLLWQVPVAIVVAIAGLIGMVLLWCLGIALFVAVTISTVTLGIYVFGGEVASLPLVDALRMAAVSWAIVLVIARVMRSRRSAENLRTDPQR